MTRKRERGGGKSVLEARQDDDDDDDPMRKQYVKGVPNKNISFLIKENNIAAEIYRFQAGPKTRLLLKEQKQKRPRISLWEYHMIPYEAFQRICPFPKGILYSLSPYLLL